MQTFSRVLTTTIIWISNHSRLAIAFESSTCIITYSTGSAWRDSTMVNQMATDCSISRIARLTAAYLCMMFRRADSILSTRIMRKTRNSACVQVAYFFFGTIIVCRALNRLTSNLFIVSVSEILWLTRAVCIMII